MGGVALRTARVSARARVAKDVRIRAVMYVTLGLALALMAIGETALGGAVLLLAGLEGVVVVVLGVSQRVRQRRRPGST